MTGGQRRGQVWRSHAAGILIAAACGRAEPGRDISLAPYAESIVPLTEGVGVLLADENTVCTTESYEYRVYCTEVNGSAVRYFGQRGEGPGEFSDDLPDTGVPYKCGTMPWLSMCWVPPSWSSWTVPWDPATPTATRTAESTGTTSANWKHRSTIPDDPEGLGGEVGRRYHVTIWNWLKYHLGTHRSEISDAGVAVSPRSSSRS